MGNKHLIVSPMPPSRCGVATYAAEHRNNLSSTGCMISIASPLPDSEADFHINVCSISGALKWLLYCATNTFDVVHFHYVDLYYFRRGYRNALPRYVLRHIQMFAIRTLCKRAARSSAIIHELPDIMDPSSSFARSRSFALAGFDEVLFHTTTMLANCRDIYPSLAGTDCRVIEHSRYMTRKFSGTTADARRKLGLPADKNILVCLGFLQFSKGFQDVVEAFSLAGSPEESELHIVGSLMKESLDQRKFLSDLSTLCASVPGSSLHVTYLSDEDFDCWLAASDVVFLPYLGVASSGVGARAQLYGKRLVIRNLPNLTDQFPDASTFANTHELAELIGNPII